MKTVAELLKVKPSRVVAVRPEQSVLEAIKVLAAEDIGAAIVMSGTHLAGIMSERDYTRKIVLKGRSSDSTLPQPPSSARRWPRPTRCCSARCSGTPTSRRPPSSRFGSRAG